MPIRTIWQRSLYGAGEESLATHSSSGPLRRQLGLYQREFCYTDLPGERGGQKHSTCFSSTVMSSFDMGEKKVLMTALRGCFSDPVAVSTLTRLLLASQNKLGNEERF